jgi:mRNA-degrading endonuclease RelE of RelBE toxin-antitoxin system
LKKPVRVVLIGNAKKEFLELNKLVSLQKKKGFESSFEMSLLSSIKQKSDILKINPFYGDNLEKRKIPKKLGVSNLWRLELNNYWRMLYTIKGDSVEVVCFILEIFNHKKYDKFLGYKKT